MIAIQELSKSYGKDAVLRDFSADIRKGKMTALIGPNGAGKSTLLELVGRLLKKDGGSVMLEGKTLGDFGKMALATTLSVLKQTQDTGLRIPVRDLVAFGRFPHSGGRLSDGDKRQIDYALRLFGLVAVQDAYINELSGGQRQRAFLAMQVAQDAAYILLDEPLNNLDMKHARATMEILRGLCDQWSKTVLLILHDLNFAARYADDLMALKAGRLLYHGPKETILRNDVLQDIFDMDIRVQELEGQLFCNYY